MTAIGHVGPMIAVRKTQMAQISGEMPKLARFGQNEIIVAAFRGKLPACEVPFFLDSFNQQNNTSLKPINAVAANRIATQETDSWNEFVRSVLEIRSTTVLLPHPFATDMLVAYERPGRKLRGEIVLDCGDSGRMVFVTGKYKGAENIGIAVKNPSIARNEMFLDGRDCVIDARDDRIILIDDLPLRSGHYLLDSKLGIPRGEEGYFEGCSSFQREDGAFVGSALRVASIGFYGAWKETVIAKHAPGEKIIIAAEAPEEDVAKLKAELSEERRAA
jgi:hypothetical protein